MVVWAAIDNLGLDRIAVISPGSKRYPIANGVEAALAGTGSRIHGEAVANTDIRARHHRLSAPWPSGLARTSR